MKIYCPAFDIDAEIPTRYTCDGENINPEIIIEDVPDEAKSLVLVFDDPDSPHGRFVHWVLYGIDAHTSCIEENTAPGNQAQNGFGERKYGGPCPASGEHRYVFTLYALKKELIIEEGEEDTAPDREFIDKSMKGFVIDEAMYTGRYRRRND